MNKIKWFAKNLINRYFPKCLRQLSSLNELAIYLVAKNRLKSFCFLEIGVFKGDNAVSIVSTIKSLGIPVRYIGFDLFDDVEYLMEHYPEDYKQYNQHDFPYWEFDSGGHTYTSVIGKLSSILSGSEFLLVKGDTMQSFPDFISAGKLVADLVYIDGCHDYEVVKSDWLNCEKLFEDNHQLMVVFDDYSYTGVRAVYDELLLNNEYKVTLLNSNQFFLSKV